MMALNRYRLKHLKKSQHKGAIKASRLIERPDRLIGLILIGNNLVNFAAASLATAIAVRLYGDAGYVISTISLAFIVLVFAEISPKTYAALHPERIAFPAAHILSPMLWLLYPLVWVTNSLTNSILKLMGANPESKNDDQLSFEELRVLMKESGNKIPKKRRSMLMNILELENVEVDDIMVPRNEIYGIDINKESQSILDQIRASEYTRLPIYRDDINDMIGIVHLRQTSRFLQDGSLDKRTLMELARDAYFIPEGTPLHTQLFNFQREKRRIAFVVDEYGVVQGLVTLEDILEEIVGDFTTNFAEQFADISELKDGTLVINGSATVRDINRSLQWELPTDGPKTLNGLLLEHLESFPDANVSLRVGDYWFEIVDIQDNCVVSAKAGKRHGHSEDWSLKYKPH